MIAAAAAALGGCAHECPAPGKTNAPAASAEAKAPAAGAHGSAVVARIGDQTITMADVDKAAGRELFDLREQALDKLITERVVEAEARRAGKSPDDFLEEKLTARVPPVSEAEAKKFYDENKAQLPEQLRDKKYADLKDMLIRGLTEQKRREALGGVLEELRKAAGAQILLEAPKVDVAATGPSKGPSDARVTIVEFSDFQCPYCARGKRVIDRVLAEYGKDVRVVFRDFPLAFHDKAQKAAEAGHCAEEQGRFWEMHDWMFDHQDALAVGDLKGAAKKLGLDGKKFDACIDGGKYGDAVAANQRDGAKAGVSGTPAFFVNGTSISGAQPFERFKTLIDRALGR
jgi:protein-disulfide isomerase